jgi:signal peptidase I
MDNPHFAFTKIHLAMETLRSYGVLQLQASGSSMLPALWPGDLLVVEAAEFDQVIPGDLVLFARDGRFFVHRVRQKTCSCLVTRGDAMPRNDAPVTRSEVLGKVSSVRRQEEWLEPAQLAAPWPITGWTLAHSDLCQRLLLRWHTRRITRMGFSAAHACEWDA